MKLEISYPFKPFIIAQHWGNLPIDPVTGKSEYAPLGFNLHNGVDANDGSLTYEGVPYTNFPVYCPVEGFTVRSVDFAPHGGGNELWLISNEPVQMGDKLAYAWMPLCHAKKIFVKAGDTPALGQLLMIGNNTGFSTGPHTHMGLYRVEQMGGGLHILDVNDANNSYNPELFFTGQFAIDLATIGTLMKNNMLYYQYLLGLK